MDVSEIIDGINRKKDELGITNQVIADSSGVPKSTVDRILRKETPNPGAQNILDMATAVGYRIGGEIQRPDFPNDEKMVEYVMQLNDDRIARMRAAHNQVLAEKDRIAAEKDKRIETYERYIHGLIISVVMLVAFIILTLALDVIHPDIGWIREQLGTIRNPVWENVIQTFVRIKDSI